VDKTIVGKGNSVFYRDEGSGLPVMLVHGFAEDGAVWEMVAARLTGGCRMLIPDLPGCGQSALPAQELSMETLADTLKNLLDREGIDRCVLIGHSMGGYISLAFVEQYPERVLAFGFFHSTAYADTAEKKANRRKSIAFIREHGAAVYIRQSTPNLFAPGTRQLDPGIIDDMIRRYSGFQQESLIAYLEAMMQRPDRISVLEQFPGPTLFIIGEKDPVIPLEQSLRQAAIPRLCHVRILATAGHMGMLEAASAGSHAIQSFLNFIIHS
jgi:pimeloyl-ACP methyl ester carboxylesterase